MRRWDKVFLVLALVSPVLLATIGWPKFAEWIATSPSQSTSSLATPETAGASATPNAVSARPTSAAQSTAAAARPTSRPTSRPVSAVTEVPRDTAAVPITPATRADEPVQAVSSFYTLVSNRDFEGAEELWSPGMRSSYPPEENLVRRFSETQAIGLQRAEVVAQSESQATVATDVLETDAQGRTRHFVGQWHLVRGRGGWLLDRPELQAAP